VTLPPGYVWIERGRGTAFSLVEAREWVEGALSRGSLHDLAAERSRKTLRGRGPVHVVTVAGVERVVRHFLRGGLPARVLRDRFLRTGASRPLRELRASETARGAGIPTPRVVAGAVYPAGMFYRADLVTDYVAGSRTLAEIMLDDTALEAREEALRAAGELTRRMATIGLEHSDLNARNILLVRVPDGLEAHLVDLDRCSVPATARPISPAPMLSRLTRSLEKIARSRGAKAPTRKELDILRTAARLVGGSR